jgi:hypothetical protein
MTHLLANKNRKSLGLALELVRWQWNKIGILQWSHGWPTNSWNVWIPTSNVTSLGKQCSKAFTRDSTTNSSNVEIFCHHGVSIVESWLFILIFGVRKNYVEGVISVSCNRECDHHLSLEMFYQLVWLRGAISCWMFWVLSRLMFL